jgi:arylsulfatase A-like enzyme
VLAFFRGVTLFIVGGAAALALPVLAAENAAPQSRPNILFVILDDLGIDQLATFGHGGVNPPKTPNIDLLAERGVKFTNVWAMPECSPSRAAMFTGRYPTRTGVEAAIMENHLPQSYMSSFEATLPRVLEKAGYASALVGKYHLGNEQDPAQDCAPSSRGWSFFQGAMTAGLPSVDATAGGMDPSGAQACGYFQTSASGACYSRPLRPKLCEFITPATAEPGASPSRTCLQRGGLFSPNEACGARQPTAADFERLNGYYVWPKTTITEARDPLYVDTADACPSEIERAYVTSEQRMDAIRWWKRQDGPRMLTLSFNAMHTPFQKAPTSVVPDSLDRRSSCSNSQPPRELLNNVLEGADAEIGRAVARMGLGQLAADGRTLKSLDLADTVLVLIGDNGSQGPAVRAADGFDPTRAKTSVYQTGVWVPLIVAGPVVAAPGRSVDALVNAADLFQLFGDIAGVKVAEIVPPSRPLDSKPLLPYLTSPDAAPIRTTNFTQNGAATFTSDPEERSWPCRIGNFCNDSLFDSAEFCADNGGVWYGPGAETQLSSCCAVKAAVGDDVTIAPVRQRAARDVRYKLVEAERFDCAAPLPANAKGAVPWADFKTRLEREFYDLQPTKTNPNGVDFAGLDLLKDCPDGQAPKTCLKSKVERAAFIALSAEILSIKRAGSAQETCRKKGDGDLDMRVTRADLRGWRAFSGAGPSVYDINLDGITDSGDRAIIAANLGFDCMDRCVRADLDRNGRVGAEDLAILNAQTGPCEDSALCGGDLNGDGAVGPADVGLMTTARRACAAL